MIESAESDRCVAAGARMKRHVGMSGINDYRVICGRLEYAGM